MIAVLMIMVTSVAFAFENPKANLDITIQQPTPIENEKTKKDAEYDKVLDSFFANIEKMFQRAFLLFDKAEAEINKVNLPKE